MSKTLRVILAASALLPAFPASAADYTFNVPVRIENMQRATEGWVACDIYQGTGASKRSIGFGRTDLAINSGAYAGTVAVNVNASPGYIATEADSWGCNLVYLWRMPDGTTFYRSLSSGDERASLYSRYTGQEVSSFHTTDGGTITH